MPTALLVAMVALGACGVVLLGLGLTALIIGGSTLVAAGGVLGVAELIVVGRVIERRQTARITAISLALVQAVFGLGLLATGTAPGLALIPLAGLVIVPLSTDSVERFFGPQP
ncbi:MAG: hypothetical protein ACJ735_02650 [Actinomycetes bacterium]